MKLKTVFIGMGLLPSLLFAYTPPREKGFYVEGAYGTGRFLNSFFGSKPKLAQLNEWEFGIFGMTAAKPGGGTRYGGGVALGFESVNQKDCGPNRCPDPGSEWDKNRSLAVSPYVRFEGSNIGLVLGASLIATGPSVLVLPKAALRMGPVEPFYASLEFLNGQNLMAEGVFKVGLGGRFKDTEVWVGGDAFPYSPGFCTRLGRAFGPVHFNVGGRIGKGMAHYIDKYGDDPTIDAEEIEFGASMGLEIRFSD